MNKLNFIKGSVRKMAFKNSQTNSFDVKHNISINVKELEAIADKKGYAHIIYKEKPKDQYGNEGMIYENDYFKNKNSSTANDRGSDMDAKSDDDLPFE